ncbi:MAG: hypothetical protein JSV85_03525 [Candidatus Bathyarchaeota archaeon]|nr:MAG: hypothetical protein JSV85_03525 [Candidatus Bathyarchaeota archaeon]
MMETQATISSPLVILQNGTAGTSTIGPNNTSAEVSVVAPKENNTEDYVDLLSNVDNSTDKGTHGNFTAQQYGPDSIFDTLTEQAFLSTDSGSKYAVTGSTSEISGAPDQTYAVVGKGGECEVMDYIDGTDAIKQVYFNITYYTEVSGTIAWAYQLDGGGWNTLENLPEGGNATNPLTRTYNATNLRVSWTWEVLNNTHIQFQNNDASGPESAYVDAMYVTVVAEFYEMDLEVQWTNADYDETYEKLAVYVGEGNNTHSLDANGGYMKVGDGTPSWGSLTGTISYWIKWDIVANDPWGQTNHMEMRVSGANLVLDWGATGSLTSSASLVTGKWYFIAVVWNENTDDLYLYIGDQDNAPTLDASDTTWGNVVSSLGVDENRFMASSGSTNGHGEELRYWNTSRSLSQIQGDYNTELNGSETNLRSYFKLNNNFEDTGPDNNDGSGSGSYSFSSDVPFDPVPAENIRVDVWNGTAWQNLWVDLSSGWNNKSVTAYLTTSNFTIRFKGNETSDTFQDSWSIDAAFLHTCTFTETSYDYVLRVNNTVTDAWEIRLKKYSDSGVSRLQNCTIYFHNLTDGTSAQIAVENGIFESETGPWYNLDSLETIYIAMTIEARSTGIADIYTYLEIRAQGATTYVQYEATFAVT